MSKSAEVQGQATKEAVYFLLAIAALVAFVLITSGCASATPQYDSNGNIISISGYGFLGDLEFEQRKPEGSGIKISSKSTSADIMKAGNELLGTVTATAAKIAP